MDQAEWIRIIGAEMVAEGSGPAVGPLIFRSRILNLKGGMGEEIGSMREQELSRYRSFKALPVSRCVYTCVIHS